MNLSKDCNLFRNWHIIGFPNLVEILYIWKRAIFNDHKAMKNYFDLSGQVAVVTGASTGLGLLLSTCRFQKEGR